MDEEMKALLMQLLQGQAAQQQAAQIEAQKAAEQPDPRYVTVEALQSLLSEFKADVTAAIEVAVPVRPEGAGRVGDEVQKASDELNPLAVVVAKPANELTRADKELKADVIRYVAAQAGN